MTDAGGAGVESADNAGAGAGDLDTLLARVEQSGPPPEERLWLREVRARLAAHPDDVEARRALESRRFAQVCRWLGIDPAEGRRRFLASVGGLAEMDPGPQAVAAWAGGGKDPAAAESDRVVADGNHRGDEAERGRPVSAGGSSASEIGPPGRRKLVLAALLAVALVTAVFFLPAGDLVRSALSRMQTLGAWGPPVLAAFYVVACVLFLPGSVLTLAAGYFFGLVTGMWTVVVGSVTGASCAFWIGRTLARRRVARWVEERPRFAAIDRAVGEDGLKVVLLTRLSPVLPFNLLNFAFGITRVSFRDYLLGSAVGMLPGTVLYVYLGTAAKNLTDVLRGRLGGGPAQSALLAVGLVATLVVTVLITRTATRALAEATDEEAPAPGA